MTMALSDRFKAAVEAFITRLTSKYDYAALYPATVIAQNGDGTLELKLDSDAMPGMSNISYRTLPGVTVKITPGARVLLGFEACNPSMPSAQLWEQGPPIELTITASAKVTVSAPLMICADGDTPVARLGDDVLIPTTSPPGLPSPGKIVKGNPKVLC